MSTYSDKLKDPRWQKMRLFVLERDNWTCQRCFDDKNTLHVHHIRYEKGKEPWDIDHDYLITLCKDCHEHETENYAIVMKTFLDIIQSRRMLSDELFTLAEMVNEMDDLGSYTLHCVQYNVASNFPVMMRHFDKDLPGYKERRDAK